MLSAHQEALGIEASASPPRLPLRTSAALPTSQAAAAGESGPLLKGHGPSSSSLPSSLPPMPLPFFPPPRHARQGSAGSQHGSGGGGGNGGSGGESPPPGASPTKQKGKGGSKLSLLEDSEDICPTCEHGCQEIAGCNKAGHFVWRLGATERCQRLRNGTASARPASLHALMPRLTQACCAVPCCAVQAWTPTQRTTPRCSPAATTTSTCRCVQQGCPLQPASHSQPS